MHIAVDDVIVTCASYTSSGVGMWQHSAKWSFDLEAGEHTLTVYAREDGVTIHQVMLTQTFYDWDENVWRGIMLEESDREEIGGVTPVTGFDVTFDANAGGDEVKDMPIAVVVESGGKVTRPVAEPVRGGYTFLGWYAEASGGEAFDFDAPITKDTVIYAQWEKDEEPTPEPEYEYGAWLEKDGELVINTVAAAKQSEYASYSNGASGQDEWAVYDENGLSGMNNIIDESRQWRVDPEGTSGYPDIHDETTPAPYLQYQINITNPGTYHLYVMMTASDKNSNNLFVAIDDIVYDCGGPSTFDVGKWQYGAWKFDEIITAGKHTLADLTEGEHTLTLYVREDGIGPNQIVLRNRFDFSDLEKSVMLEESEREIVSVTE